MSLCDPVAFTLIFVKQRRRNFLSTCRAFTYHVVLAEVNFGHSASSTAYMAHKIRKLLLSEFTNKS
jgi:hypothetical protein